MSQDVKKLSSQQSQFSSNEERLMMQLVKSIAAIAPKKTFQADKAVFNEIILEVEIDGLKYCLVRCQPALDSPITLSSRELAIAKLIAQGFSNKCISSSLQISQWTVNTYLRRIFGKLGVTSRAAMVMRLMETGLLQQESN